ncbi:MAG: sugar transferase [Allorhizobium sp.]|uniref:sugar transferase n=1 Tax=Allorhizobium sp. TaxID=633478 RepID=UPI0040349124
MAYLPASHRRPVNMRRQHAGFAWHQANTRARIAADSKLKRLFDILVSASALVFFLPALLAVAILIKLDSPGPILFKQKRWGKGGSEIVIYKFRSMKIDECDTTGVKQTVHKDPRLTLMGTWLRRTNIDELPQLWNILIGNMSLVGPRCHAIGMMAAGVPYEELVPHYAARHAVKPGLTGLAQVRGLRGPTDRPSKAKSRIACDLYYIQNYSIWLDLWILFATIRNELRGGTGF